MTIRTEAVLAAASVTDFSTGRLRRLRTPRAARPTADVVTRRAYPSAVRAALRAAGQDATRLWFDDDGAVWVLNHLRTKRCAGRACPACQPGF